MAGDFHVPPSFRRGQSKDEEVGRRSALFSLTYLLQHFRLESFAETRMLDVGCGTKFTQCLLENGFLIGQYVGVDVYREMVEFLKAEVEDPRFEFHHVDLHNARYNPTGRKLTDETRLPVDEEAFDLIVLFSVFTHLEPDDYRAMLHILRRHVRRDGRLFFTLFLDERTAGGHGAIDAYAARLGDAVVGTTDGYQDFLPDNPLAVALYTRDHALALIDGTGWEVVSVDPPNEHMQHHITCRPV